jgi:D-inositol-3-phosphate glycosyltransferase
MTAARVLLFVGRLDPIKGVDTLLQAFALLDRVKDVALIIVGGSSGEGDELARLKALASDLGIARRVEFRPPVPQQELPFYYSAATATVVPSRHESFGLVAVESLACGTLVVASNRGGLRTTVRDGQNGLLVYDISPEGFAARLAGLLGDEALERRLRARARDSVRGYSWDAVGEAVLAEYKALTPCTCRCGGGIRL